MAVGTVLTIATALLPLIPRIKNAIRDSEDTVGPGNGSKKKELAVNSVIPFVKFLKDRGTLPDDVDAVTVSDFVETIFQLMKHDEGVGGPVKTGTQPARFQITGEGTVEFVA